MANVLKLKRGDFAALPTLQDGEPAFCKDTNQLFMGRNGANIEVEAVHTLTHSKVGTVHNLTGTIPVAGLATVRFKATAPFASGDSININNIVYTAKTSTGGEYSAEFAENAIIIMEADVMDKTLTIQSGGGGGSGGSVKVKIFDTLPSLVEENIIAVITTTPCNFYTVDMRMPANPQQGDIFVMQYDSDNMLSQGDGAKGRVNIRLGQVKQRLSNAWRSQTAYIGTNGAWVQISTNQEIYGIKIDKNNSDPFTRVQYTDSAVGMRPMFMNYDKAEFNYGDWYPFISEMFCPVMLNRNGTEAYELDRDNQNKKADGSPSDIANQSFDGNAMVRVKKLYVKAWSDANYDYVQFSKDKISDAFNAFPFINEKGIEQNQLYMPMFKARTLATMRSIKGLEPTISAAASTEISWAAANGNGYTTQYWSVWNFKMQVLWLLGRSTNTQFTFGSGNSSGNSTALQTGTLADKGACYGYKETNKQVKILWSEVWWGDLFDRIMGCVTNASTKILVKNTPPYNIAGTGYTDIGANPGNGYFKNITLSEYGMYIKTLGGSDTTYFCDYAQFAANCYAVVGGHYGNGGRCGASYLYLINSASSAHTGIGASLFYLKP